MLVRRPVLIIAIGAAVGLAVASACAPDTRYRMLRYFFDGVPEPGAKQPPGYAPPEPTTPTASAPIHHTPAVPIFTHTPFRQDRCEGCHNPKTRQLLRPLEEGLCLNCHAPLIRNPRFAHGPAAVAACTFCHHHHASPFKYQLRDEPNKVCTKCHDMNDLMIGSHHATIETQTCTNCHNPHGGDNRFFLKRKKA